MKPNIIFKYFSLFLLLFLPYLLNAQAPKREFRGVWIATVGNIDWPSRSGLSATQQQIEFVNKLDFLASNGFNAVIVQIRPASDAFYPSSLEPWSRYLSGKQGEAPLPFYDPLAFMVKETHKRNMEFHAWFNPFRALVNSRINPNPANHITKTHPQWMIHYGGKSYLDPGIPEARNYVNQVILDVVKRYDIDGVHIDDYFYPYKIAGQTFNDSKSYNLYNRGLSLDDWRRDNINKFISAMYLAVKKEKSYVKVGISPFGIWRNQSKDPLGSRTNGTACYDDLYADVKYWIEQKWLDYVAPQLYWEHGHRIAAYDVLVPWWKNICKDRALYIGMGVYRMVDAKTGPWLGKNEILNQITTARNFNADGQIAYSLISLQKVAGVLSPTLKLPPYYGNIAIPPTMPWLGKTAPAAPMANINRQTSKVILSWNTGTTISSNVKYLVYKFNKNEIINLENSSKMYVLTQSNSFTDEAEDISNSKYVVTTLDRLWNESKPSEVLE
ncbi:MAG TPA: family 10 glycosylhydrolase [Edaphocola sp.]|nr:family 10 glycosylhydrolase [Edaphocola sp.]